MFIIIVLILSATATGVIYYGAYYPDPRMLTDEEQTYAKSIYGDAIDYSAVHMYTDTIYTLIASMTLGNAIHLKQSDVDEEANTLSSKERFILIHELGHVFQYQHNGWSYLLRSFASQFQAYIQTGTRTNAYDWRSRITDSDAYDAWNPEEQAEALAEFARERDAIDAGSRMRDTSIEKLSCLIPLLSATYCENGNR
jgi:hypothetical protein